MRARGERALVLGAGLQGVCAALALQRIGYPVTLLDASPGCLLGSSARGEGKVHLGLVYAHDASFRTAELMLRSALCFGHILEDLAGAPIDWRSLVSSPFSYVVARDTMVPLPDLVDFYERLSARARDWLDADPSCHYLGERPRTLTGAPVTSESIPWIGRELASHVIPTVEFALDTRPLAGLLQGAISRAARLRTRYGCRVESVRRTSVGFEVTGRDSAVGRPFVEEAEIVVNCLWSGRLAIDQQMGLLPSRPWMYRLKYRILGDLPAALASMPAVTLVVGPYGDIVTYPNALTYVSWYPRCMTATSSDVAPPASWEGPCRGQAEPSESAAVARASLDEIDRAVPGLSGFRVKDVAACVIFSWGRTDIEDPESELHERWDIGVHASDGYFTIDTGKLTCAPLFASRLAEALS